MKLLDFTNRVIDEGIAAVKEDYKDPKDKDKLDGAIEGFELCRDKEPHEIEVLLIQAREATLQAQRERSDNYWTFRCRDLEIEWVANCVSFVLQSAGEPVIIPPTIRGAIKAVSIIGA